MPLPAVNLAILQPPGHLHSLGYLDHARHFRHQFRRLGASVTISKNRLREDAVNFVFGAHLGFPLEWRHRNACVIVNLEELGPGGAQIPSEYLALLSGGAVVDCDAQSARCYAHDPAAVPLVPFLHAPYLDDGSPLPIEQRPIDLLFLGSMNERSRAFVRRVEEAGVQVSLLDQPLFGPERDLFVRQAKAVITCPPHAGARFDQALASQCLSLGTPLIADGAARGRASAPFDEAVFWLDGDGDGIERFFAQGLVAPGFLDEVRARVSAFQRHDPIEAYAAALAFAVESTGAVAMPRSTLPWRPERLNLGAGKGYRAGWLNVDRVESTEPDVLLDLDRPLELPVRLPTRGGGQVVLEAGGLRCVHAEDALVQSPDLAVLMTNLLSLLCEGGELDIQVPYGKSPSAWQDPSHVRAMNEDSWIHWTDGFWATGWFEHRFEVVDMRWLDRRHAQVPREHAALMRVLLRKVPTTVGERTVARVMRADFGGIQDDGPADAPPARPVPQARNTCPVSEAMSRVLIDFSR